MSFFSMDDFVVAPLLGAAAVHFKLAYRHSSERLVELKRDIAEEEEKFRCEFKRASLQSVALSVPV